MKKVRNNLTVLERQLNELFETHHVIVPTVAIPYIRNSMKSFAVNAIQDYKRNKRKEMIGLLKSLPGFFRLGYTYFLKLWIRKQFLKIAVKTAKLRAETEGYWMYIVQSGEVSYKVVSSQDFKHGKKIKVFKRDLTFMDLQRTACKVVKPENVVIKVKK
jgi:hypothetical protein